MNKNLVISTLLLTLLSGCASPQKAQEKMLSADYGSPVSKSEFESLVRDGMEFFDPSSALITCTEPRKGMGEDYLYQQRFGWISHCKYNAKNRYGGYVGEKSQSFIAKNRSIELIHSHDWKYLE